AEQLRQVPRGALRGLLRRGAHEVRVFAFACPLDREVALGRRRTTGLTSRPSGSRKDDTVTGIESCRGVVFSTMNRPIPVCPASASTKIVRATPAASGRPA